VCGIDVADDKASSRSTITVLAMTFGVLALLTAFVIGMIFLISLMQ